MRFLASIFVLMVGLASRAEMKVEMLHPNGELKTYSAKSLSDQKKSFEAGPFTCFVMYKTYEVINEKGAVTCTMKGSSAAFMLEGACIYDKKGNKFPKARATLSNLEEKDNPMYELKLGCNLEEKRI